MNEFDLQATISCLSESIYVLYVLITLCRGVLFLGGDTNVGNEEIFLLFIEIEQPIFQAQGFAFNFVIRLSRTVSSFVTIVTLQMEKKPLLAVPD
jgi:hypothetical protein